jgi:hypothetical protein
MRVACSIVITVAALASRVDAQPALTAPLAAPSTGETELRDPSRARLLSISIPVLTMAASLAVMTGGDDEAAAVGLPLFLAGAIVGPSTGLWYAGHQGGKGMLARGGAGLLVMAGISSAISGNTHDGCSSEECERRDDRAEQAAVVFISAGAVAFLASWIYDVRAAGRIVERNNRAINATLVPTVMPTAVGGQAPGAMLSGTF